MKKRGNYLWGFLISGLVFLSVGCEKNAIEPEGEKLAISPQAKAGLVSGWKTLSALTVTKEVEGMVTGQDMIEKSDLGGFYSQEQVTAQFLKMRKGLVEGLTFNNGNTILDGDSLLFFIDWTDPVSGISVRKALYYNTETGIARYYETIYQFPPHVQLEFDSTEIRVDLNFTLFNLSDDKFLSAFKFTRFKENFYVESIEAQAQVTDYGPDNEVTGAILQNTVLYGQQNPLEKLSQQLEINPDESGSIFERLDYRDGTFRQVIVNLYADYTGDFSETWRNGITASGTFDRLEDDNHGSFSRTIQFPSGYSLDRIEQMADVTLNPSDSSSFVLLRERRYFVDGRLDTTQVNVNEFYEEGLKKTRLEVQNSDGSHGELLTTHYQEYQQTEGNYTSPEGFFMLVNIISYNDGSGDLWLTIYQSEEAYQNGDPPLLEIHIHYNPDGSGEGEITEGQNKYQVQVNQDGQMVVQDAQGNTLVVNGY